MTSRPVSAPLAPPEKREDGVPSVAVIMPARNEQSHIAAALGALRSLDYPRDAVEVVVVDNGSTDDTARVAATEGATVHPSSAGNVGGVRNAGAAATNSEIVAFLDSDCVPGPDWLGAAVRELADGRVGIAGGRYVPNPSGNWIERIWGTAPPESTRVMNALPGGSIVLRRDTFEELGGFSETLAAGEDDDLCRRAREAGYVVLGVPDCYVVHLGTPKTLRRVFLRQVWHGSDHLSAADSLLDRQLVLSHVALLGVVGLVVGLAAGSPMLMLYGSLAFGVATVSLATFKVRSAKLGLAAWSQLLLVALVFYLGRSVGLVLSYARTLRSYAASRSAP